MDKKLTIIRDEQTALTIYNPTVQSISCHLRWRPETTVARIKRALPAILEQQIYLALAPQTGESGILPESLAKLLRLYLGDQELQLEDLDPRSLWKTRFNSFREFLGDCINLLKIITKEYYAFSLTITDAGMIVLHYGNDDPERLIEMVDNNLEAICDVLDISNSLSYSLRMRICISIVVNKIIPKNHSSACPDLLDLTDLLNMTSVGRHNLRMALSQELPDYLSEDYVGLRSYESLRILREWGIV
jgi:hypothetical protein